MIEKKEDHLKDTELKGDDDRAQKEMRKPVPGPGPLCIVRNKTRVTVNLDLTEGQDANINIHVHDKSNYPSPVYSHATRIGENPDNEVNVVSDECLTTRAPEK